jgi:hypothetical protein
VARFCRQSTADGKEAFFIKIKADTNTRNLRGYKNYISKKSEKRFEKTQEDISSKQIFPSWPG